MGPSKSNQNDIPVKSESTFDNQGLSTAQKGLPIQFFAGEAAVAVMWASRVYKQYSRKAPQTAAKK